MYERASAPKSIGGVLDDAIRLYRQVFPKVVPLNIVAAVALAFPTLYLGLQAANLQKGDPTAAFALFKSPSVWITYLLIVLVALVVQSALISAIDTFANGHEPTVGAAFAVGLSRLPRLVVAGIVIALIVAVGFVLLVIPGIYLWGIFQLVFIAIIVDNVGAFESLGVSSRLIKGNWWRAATVFTVAVIILIVLSFIGGFVNGIAAVTLGLDSSVAVVIRTVIGAIMNILIIPLLPCFQLAMFYDLKLRHDGGDLAARVDTLART